MNGSLARKVDISKINTLAVALYTVAIIITTVTIQVLSISKINNMNLEQLQNEPKRVKIIDSTYDANENAKKMIGGVYEVRSEYHFDHTLTVWNEDKTQHWYFNKKDTQITTPLKFNDEYICIADTVNENELVYGYRWFDGEYVLDAAEDNNFESRCFRKHILDIRSHQPLNPTNKIDLSDDELIQELERRGKLADGKVIK